MRAISCILLLRLCALAQDPLAAGMEAYRLGHLRAATGHLEAALRANPGNVAAQAFLALARAGAGQCDAQLPVLQGLWHGTGAPELRRLAGLAALQCALSQGTPEQGVTLLAELQAAYPRDADVLYLGAKLYLKGWNAQVAEMFAKNPGSYRVNQLSAEIFETEGNYTEAAAEYARAIQKNPQALNLHYRRGRALLLGSHEAAALEAARHEFEAELSLNAEDAAAEYQAGQILEVQGHRDAAEKRFEQARALRPDFPEALLALAKIRARQGRQDDATALLQRVVALQPDNETAHYNLLLAYRKAGQTEAAAREKETLDRLQRPPAGEFSDFLKKLGEKPKP